MLVQTFSYPNTNIRTGLHQRCTAFGELVVNFSDSHISDSVDTIIPVIIDLLFNIPFTDFDRSLSWDGDLRIVKYKGSE